MSDALFQLSVENWHQVQDLLADALERPSAQRAAFLDAACAGTPSLRAEVESLLEAYTQADGFLDELDTAGVAALLAKDEDAETGREVGPYRIVRVLGRGGMGTVYLAERATGQFDQQVALKLIKRGMDSEAILRRFLTERQILARLHHPHIARLYDGDISDDGRPYFAMEFVEGVPITRFCDDHRLGVEARLRLFLDVCRAVQYAHQNLVVHRDLKPSNMMVTDEGQLKLLDFGIAKLLDEGADAQEPMLTAPGLRVMTPEYAAPEQVRGEAITTATDVYALGVVLYELLTGHRPYRFDRRTAEAVAQVLAKTTPAQPSTAIHRTEEIRHADGTTETITPEVVSRDRGMSLDRLRRRLSGDLDMVVLKALRQEPQRRYPSAETFLEDLKRHLAGLPVQAHRDTLTYRASKFIRRHTVGVVAAAAFVVLLAGFAVAMAFQQVQTAKERDKVEEVKDFVLSLFEASNPLEEAKGDTITARTLLERGVARIDAELQGQPEIQAEMLAVVGNIYYVLGRYDRAEPLLEQALALRQDRLGNEHLDVAESLYQLGKLHYQKGNYPAADSLFQEALAIRQDQLGTTHLDVAEVLDMMGSVRWRQSDYPAADSLFQAVLMQRRSLLGPSHPQIALSLTNLGVMARAQGEYETAEARHREALAIRRAHFGEQHRLVGESLKNLALVFHSQNRYEEAEELYRQALDLQTQLYDDDHPDIASTLNSLASLLRMKGDFDEAEPLFQQALAIRRRLLGPSHPSIAATLSNLADFRSRKGDLEAAQALREEALAMRRELFDSQHPSVATSLNNIAFDLRTQGRYAEAIPLQEEVLTIYRARLGPAHPWVAIALINMATTRFGLHTYTAADSLYRQALAIQRDALPPSDVNLAIALVGLGKVALAQDRPQDAESMLREALELREKALPEDHWRTAEAQSVLGACLSALGRFEEAEPLLLDGYNRLKESQGKQNETQRALQYLAAHYERRGLPEQAAAYRRGTSEK